MSAVTLNVDGMGVEILEGERGKGLFSKVVLRKFWTSSRVSEGEMGFLARRRRGARPPRSRGRGRCK